MFFFFSILFSTLLFVKILLWKIPFFPFFLSFSSSSSFSVFKKSKKKKKIYWFGYYNSTAVCLCVKGLLASVAFILCKFLFFCFFFYDCCCQLLLFFFFAWFDNQKPTTNSIRQLKAVNQSKVATAAVRGWRRCTKGKTRREEIDRSKKKKKGVQDGISTTYVNCWLGKINKKEQKKMEFFIFFLSLLFFLLNRT